MNVDSLKKGLDIENLTIKNDQLFDIQKNIEYNKKIIQYYKRLLFNSRYVNSPSYRKEAVKFDKYDASSIDWNEHYQEKIVTMENKISNIMNCNSLWLLDVYDIQKRKVLMKTNLCHDRFCHNCKKVKQATMMQRFIPEIEKFKKYDLYHLTLTVPNVGGYDLRYMVDVMAKSFARLIDFFNIKKKKRISGVDFSKYGYMGAVRSLEVTYNKNEFHPHYHVLLVLNYKDTEKVHVNDFSKKFGKVVNKFSDLEILIQKLWYLLIKQEKIKSNFAIKIENVENSKLSSSKKDTKLYNLDKLLREEIRKNTINKNVIDNLDRGYSCTMFLFKEDNYFELFKYMTKVKTDEKEVFNYQSFVHLYFELKGVRQIQGYGCLFRIGDKDLKDEVDIVFQTFEAYLQLIELPRKSSETTRDLAFESDYKLMSKNTLFKWIKLIEDKEKEEETAISSSVG